MTRQSISLTNPNNDWLKAQIESEEYASKSDVVNALIRKARKKEEERDWIRAKLIKAEQSGFVNQTPEEMLKEFKEEARRNGEL